MTGHYSSSLTSQDRSKHLAWIGVRVEALLDGYWRADVSDPVKGMVLADWISALEAFSPDEITAACREWLNAEPRRKPKPGDIRRIILNNRAKAIPPRYSERPQDRSTPSPEQAEIILRKAGFKPRRFGSAR